MSPGEKRLREQMDRVCLEAAAEWEAIADLLEEPAARMQAAIWRVKAGRYRAGDGRHGGRGEQDGEREMAAEAPSPTDRAPTRGPARRGPDAAAPSTS
jgi:hypothetical protein